MSDEMQTVNFAEKFATFEEYWTPKIIGELNGQYLKIAKLKVNLFGIVIKAKMNFSGCQRQNSNSS